MSSAPRFLPLLLIAISCGVLPVQAAAAVTPNEKLVLMPLRIPAEDKSLEGAMESALVKGLQQKYEVFSGEQVQQTANKSESERHFDRT